MGATVLEFWLGNLTVHFASHITYMKDGVAQVVGLLLKGIQLTDRKDNSKLLCSWALSWNKVLNCEK